MNFFYLPSCRYFKRWETLHLITWQEAVQMISFVVSLKIVHQKLFLWHLQLWQFHLCFCYSTVLSGMKGLDWMSKEQLLTNSHLHSVGLECNLYFLSIFLTWEDISLDLIQKIFACKDKPKFKKFLFCS